MRKSELTGLSWSDVDLVQGRVLVSRQLLKGGPEPTFTVPKAKRARTIHLATETVDLLKAHRVHQVELKRLNHKKIQTTLTANAHVLPGQQREAARRLASILHRT